MNEILKELLEGLDLREKRELKGFSRYSVDLSGKIFDKITGDFKKNTPNSKGYVYHTLKDDNNKSVTVSMHQIVMAAALSVEIGWWKQFNLVIDHRNDNPSQNNFENLQLITQSANLKKRENVKSCKRFSKEEIEELYNDFEQLEDIVHGQYHHSYEQLANKFGCSAITIQLRYLDYKKAQ